MTLFFFCKGRIFKMWMFASSLGGTAADDDKKTDAATAEKKTEAAVEKKKKILPPLVLEANLDYFRDIKTENRCHFILQLTTDISTEFLLDFCQSLQAQDELKNRENTFTYIIKHKVDAALKAKINEYVEDRDYKAIFLANDMMIITQALKNQTPTHLELVKSKNPTFNTGLNIIMTVDGSTSMSGQIVNFSLSNDFKVTIVHPLITLRDYGVESKVFTHKYVDSGKKLPTIVTKNYLVPFEFRKLVVNKNFKNDNQLYYVTFIACNSINSLIMLMNSLSLISEQNHCIYMKVAGKFNANFLNFFNAFLSLSTRAPIDHTANYYIRQNGNDMYLSNFPLAQGTVVTAFNSKFQMNSSDPKQPGDIMYYSKMTKDTGIINNFRKIKPVAQKPFVLPDGDFSFNDTLELSTIDWSSKMSFNSIYNNSSFRYLIFCFNRAATPYTNWMTINLIDYFAITRVHNFICIMPMGFDKKHLNARLKNYTTLQNYVVFFTPSTIALDKKTDNHVYLRYLASNEVVILTWDSKKVESTSSKFIYNILEDKLIANHRMSTVPKTETNDKPYFLQTQPTFSKVLRYTPLVLFNQQKLIAVFLRMNNNDTASILLKMEEYLQLYNNIIFIFINTTNYSNSKIKEVSQMNFSVFGKKGTITVMYPRKYTVTERENNDATFELSVKSSSIERILTFITRYRTSNNNITTQLPVKSNVLIPAGEPVRLDQATNSEENFNKNLYPTRYEYLLLNDDVQIYPMRETVFHLGEIILDMTGQRIINDSIDIPKLSDQFTVPILQKNSITLLKNITEYDFDVMIKVMKKINESYPKINVVCCCFIEKHNVSTTMLVRLKKTIDKTPIDYYYDESISIANYAILILGFRSKMHNFTRNLDDSDNLTISMNDFKFTITTNVGSAIAAKSNFAVQTDEDQELSGFFYRFYKLSYAYEQTNENIFNVVSQKNQMVINVYNIEQQVIQNLSLNVVNSKFLEQYHYIFLIKNLRVLSLFLAYFTNKIQTLKFTIFFDLSQMVKYSHSNLQILNYEMLKQLIDDNFHINHLLSYLNIYQDIIIISSSLKRDASQVVDNIQLTNPDQKVNMSMQPTVIKYENFENIININNMKFVDSMVMYPNVLLHKVKIFNIVPTIEMGVCAILKENLLQNKFATSTNKVHQYMTKFKMELNYNILYTDTRTSIDVILFNKYTHLEEINTILEIFNQEEMFKNRRQVFLFPHLNAVHGVVPAFYNALASESLESGYISAFKKSYYSVNAGRRRFVMNIPPFKEFLFSTTNKLGDADISVNLLPDINVTVDNPTDKAIEVNSDNTRIFKFTPKNNMYTILQTESIIKHATAFKNIEKITFQLHYNDTPVFPSVQNWSKKNIYLLFIDCLDTDVPINYLFTQLLTFYTNNSYSINIFAFHNNQEYQYLSKNAKQPQISVKFANNFEKLQNIKHYVMHNQDRYKFCSTLFLNPDMIQIITNNVTATSLKANNTLFELLPRHDHHSKRKNAALELIKTGNKSQYNFIYGPAFPQITEHHQMTYLDNIGINISVGKLLE